MAAACLRAALAEETILAGACAGPALSIIAERAVLAVALLRAVRAVAAGGALPASSRLIIAGLPAAITGVLAALSPEPIWTRARARTLRSVIADAAIFATASAGAVRAKEVCRAGARARSASAIVTHGAVLAAATVLALRAQESWLAEASAAVIASASVLTVTRRGDLAIRAGLPVGAKARAVPICAVDTSLARWAVAHAFAFGAKEVGGTGARPCPILAIIAVSTVLAVTREFALLAIEIILTNARAALITGRAVLAAAFGASRLREWRIGRGATSAKNREKERRRADERDRDEPGQVSKARGLIGCHAGLSQCGRRHHRMLIHCYPNQRRRFK